MKVLEKTEYTRESVALAVFARGINFVGMISYAEQIENQKVELEKAFLQSNPYYLMQKFMIALITLKALMTDMLPSPLSDNHHRKTAASAKL